MSTDVRNRQGHITPVQCPPYCPAFSLEHHSSVPPRCPSRASIVPPSSCIALRSLCQPRSSRTQIPVRTPCPPPHSSPLTSPSPRCCPCRIPNAVRFHRGRPARHRPSACSSPLTRSPADHRGVLLRVAGFSSRLALVLQSPPLLARVPCPSSLRLNDHRPHCTSHTRPRLRPLLANAFGRLGTSAL